MINNEILKKQIIYRSMHRGSREMDILLGSFVKKYIHQFDKYDLQNLQKILLFEDEIIHNWYFMKIDKNDIPKNKVSSLLKNFKL